jgi:hypothetical protein
VTIYDRKTTPLRPARVITVSGPADRALATVVSMFTVRKFRVTTPAGALPLKLELSRWWLAFLVLDIFTPSNHGIVSVRVDTRPDATVVLTVLVLTSWSAHRFSPVFLTALNEAVTAFSEAGVLIHAGPIIDGKTLR